MMIVTDRNSKTSPPAIDFKPRTDEERQHLAKLKRLLESKRRGDWGLVGEMIGCEAQTAEKSFRRVFSKNHLMVVEALEKIISNRTQLLKN